MQGISQLEQSQGILGAIRGKKQHFGIGIPGHKNRDETEINRSVKKDRNGETASGLGPSGDGSV